MPLLGVNIDHVATIRQARKTAYPDPLSAVGLVESAGADQITIHLREDRRHIQDSDLRALRQAVTTLLNLEMASVSEIVDIACEVKPDICTFVPERRQELTTESGLDVVNNVDKLMVFIRKLKEKSIVTSAFIDPEIAQVEASKELLFDTVELHTGRYAELFSDKKAGDGTLKEELSKIKKSALRAKEIGLRVAAGHGLNYDNISLMVKEIPQIEEYNIGHSIIARAVFTGIAHAVTEMKKLLEEV